MIFSDDDLKRLKDKIDQPGYERHTKQYKTLIARLEAAEYLISVSPKSGRDITSYWDAFDAWRKVSGKSK